MHLSELLTLCQLVIVSTRVQSMSKRLRLFAICYTVVQSLVAVLKAPARAATTASHLKSARTRARHAGSATSPGSEVIAFHIISARAFSPMVCGVTLDCQERHKRQGWRNDRPNARLSKDDYETPVNVTVPGSSATGLALWLGWSLFRLLNSIVVDDTAACSAVTGMSSFGLQPRRSIGRGLT